MHFPCILICLAHCGLKMLVEPVELVVRKAKELAHHSWEYGVVSEALIELYDPHLSVFSEDLAKVRERSSCKDSNVAGLEYAQRFIRLDQQTLADGEGEKRLCGGSTDII